MAFQSITKTHMTTRKIPVCPCGARSSDLVNRSRADEEGLTTGISPKAKWNLSEANRVKCDSWSTLTSEDLLFCLLLLLLCLPLHLPPLSLPPMVTSCLVSSSLVEKPSRQGIPVSTASQRGS